MKVGDTNEVESSVSAARRLLQDYSPHLRQIDQVCNLSPCVRRRISDMTRLTEELLLAQGNPEGEARDILSHLQSCHDLLSDLMALPDVRTTSSMKELQEQAQQTLLYSSLGFRNRNRRVIRSSPDL